MKLGKKKSEKHSTSTGFKTVTSTNTGAILYQLSYEATHWEPSQFCGFNLSFPMKEIDGRINENILHGGEKQANARS